MKSVYRFVNNMKLRNKLIAIYFLCVFVPIVVCNLVFYFNIRQTLIQYEMERTEMSLNRMGESLIQSVQEVFSVSEVIYNDAKLNGDIERDYESFIEYSEAYNFNLKFTLSKFYPIYSQIKDITIFTTNPTITTSAGFSIFGAKEQETKWYKNLMDASSSTTVYFDEDVDSIFLVRKLDNFRDVSQYSKFLVIQFRKEVIRNILKSENLKGNLTLVTDEEQIVSQNVYTTVDNSTNGNILLMEKRFDNSKFFKGWQIKGVFIYDEIMSEMKGAGNYIIMIMLLSLFVATIIIVVISKSLSKRMKILSRHINSVGKNDFEQIEAESSHDEIGSLIQEFNHMVVLIKGLIQDVYESSLYRQELELEMKQSQINALQSQINPHFLFNTFESIRMRCVLKGEDETADIIQALSKNFRRMISWDDDMVSIASEIEFIEAFLKIQQYRFKDKINYEITVEPNCLQYLIPKMTIQPLVENAVEHGLAKKRGKGNICIKIECQSDLLYCKVIDNGIGMTQDKLENLRDSLESKSGTNKSIGVKNVYRRLKLIYGSTDFKIDSEINAGTVISFTTLAQVDGDYSPSKEVDYV